MDDLRYPIGRFAFEQPADPALRPQWIDEIAQAPALLADAVAGLSDFQLDTPYRLGGWTLRQVVHHVADSHLNCYARFRFALTEDAPAIRSFDESRWAELADARSGPVEVSLALLGALHRRWVALAESLAPADFARTFRHPELGPRTLDQTLALYAWHGRHHTAQIASLRSRTGW